MVNSYSGNALVYNTDNAPLAYTNQPYVVQEPVKQSQPLRLNKTTAATVCGAGLGAVAGITVGAIKNPYINNGSATDEFVKRVYEKYAKSDDAVKKIYKQENEILSKLRKVRSVDDLKTLFNNNKEAAKEYCDAVGKTPDEFIENVTKNNLSSNKKTIKEKLSAEIKTRFQSAKNDIEKCWNKSEKKFAKADGVSDKMFEAINKSKGGMKAMIIGKYALIATAVGACAGFLSQMLGKPYKNVQKR